MRNLLFPAFLMLCLSLTTLRAQNPSGHYPIQPIPFHTVQLTDPFWAPRQETVRKVTIPVTFQKCEETGRIKNFEIAGGAAEGKFCTNYVFDDSDIYKSIEGAAYALHTHRDPKLEAYIDSLIAKVAAAQESDGYLYTWRTIRNRNAAAASGEDPHLGWASEDRWKREDQISHETYNAGHLYEAAVAWYQATGKRKLLDIALKNADLLVKDFGWGKLEKAPGHQEVELGLVKLYQASGKKEYLDLAKFFLDVRGYGDAYMQNHQKVKDQRKAAGHAVRLGYMFAAAADVTALLNDDTYLPAMKAVWDDIVHTQLYITGGVGATGSNEGFGAPYDLPNYSAYCETCSSIAFAMWTQRMFQLTGESGYIDVLERTLYNALNAGLSLSGDAFFYPNPLESRKNVERSPWFSCACCPPNLTRFYSSLGSYLYAQQDNHLYVNLYAASSTQFQTTNSKGLQTPVNLRQETEYPWDGMVRIPIDPLKPAEFALHLRVPGWAREEAVPADLYHFQDKLSEKVVVKVNGKAVLPTYRNGYAVIDRKWKKGDIVEINLPMPVRRIAANPLLEADIYKNALQRGPLVYCLEGKDQPDDRVLNLMLSQNAPLLSRYLSDPQLEGVRVTVTGEGQLVSQTPEGEGLIFQDQPLYAIPYYAWANRGKDNMAVWLPFDPRGARAIGRATLASQSKISASEGLKGPIGAVTDQYLPKNSNDHENPFVHWWPRFGTTEWLQYDFAKAEQVGTVRVYWFDDEAIGGGCRIPKSWRVLYLENGEWKPVYSATGFPVIKDGWNEVQFEPVKTTALRLELQLQEGVSAGVHEWEVR